MKAEIQSIPISQIRILNPRVRDKQKFEHVVTSIRNLGLKKPIQVSRRGAGEDTESGFDLVCGQGRIEAFVALGHHSIPAIVVSVSKEERLLRSLIENVARRCPSHGDLMTEIVRLKNLHYSNVAIGKKLDISDMMVGGFLALKNAGEERLLEAALSGKVPITVAIEIAKTEGVEAQRELLKAVENKQLNGVSIRMVKRLLEQRQFLGKSKGGASARGGTTASSESMVQAYCKESDRLKAHIKKARICDAKLSFFVEAFRRLLADQSFVTLLRAEGLGTLPKDLADRVENTPQLV